MTPGTQRTFSGGVGSGAAGPGAYHATIDMQHRPSAVRLCFIVLALITSADITKAEWAGQQPQEALKSSYQTNAAGLHDSLAQNDRTPSLVGGFTATVIESAKYCLCQHINSVVHLL